MINADPRRKRKKRGEKRKQVPKSPFASRFKSVFSRIGSKSRGRKERRVRSPSQASSRSGNISTHLGAQRQEQMKKNARELIKSYATCSSKHQIENDSDYHHREREASSGRRNNEPSESEDSARGRHWKRSSRKTSRRANSDLSKPYNEESTTPFTWRINEFVFPKRIEKVYHRSGGTPPCEAKGRKVYRSLYGALY
nr:hypothetical protein [Tanacetum cinerariifolium]